MNTIIDGIDKQISREWAEEQQKYGIVVIPYEIVSGYIVNSEEGQIEITKAKSPENYTQFEQIFLGKDAINIVWKNAKPWFKPLGVNRATFIDRTGDYYMGKLISGQSHSAILTGEQQQFEENKTRYVSDSFSMRFDFPESTITENIAELENNLYDKHYFFPQEKDKFNLYMIPELANNKLFQLIDFSYHTASDGNGICAVECMFQTIENTFKNTGIAVEQFINFAAPGDPYTLPIVNTREDGTKEVTHKQIDAKPITHIQIEFLGAAAISGFSIYGRKLNITENEDGDKIYSFNQWQYLFPYSLYQPQKNLTAQTSSPSKNFFFFPQSTLSMNYSKALFDTYKAQYNSVSQNNYCGVLMTNSENQNDWDNIENGLHKSNPLVDGMWKDYFDSSWYPTSFLSTQPTFNCSGNLYTVNTLNYRNNMNCVEILAMNGIMYNNQLELPLSFRSTKPFYISNLPLIGGMIAALCGDRAMFANTKSIIPMKLGLFMDATIAGALHAIKLDNTWAGIFLDSLGDKEKINWTAGSNACNTSICFELTNNISLDGVLYDTKYLGQSKKENGEYILNNHDSLLFNDSFELVEKDDGVGFSIDKIIIYALFNGKVHINYYSYDESGFVPVYQTTIRTNTDYTGSYRNWATEITAGCISEKQLEINDSFTYPELPTKTKTSPIDYTYNLSWQSGNPLQPEDMNQYFDLSHTGEKIRWYSNKLNERELTITYSSLLIPGVNDLTTFESWYENSNKTLSVEVNNSYFSLKGYITSEIGNRNNIVNETLFPSSWGTTYNKPIESDEMTFPLFTTMNNLDATTIGSILGCCAIKNGVTTYLPADMTIGVKMKIVLEQYQIKIKIWTYMVVIVKNGVLPDGYDTSTLKIATVRPPRLVRGQEEYIGWERIQNLLVKINSIKFQ